MMPRLLTGSLVAVTLALAAATAGAGPANAADAATTDAPANALSVRFTQVTRTVPVTTGAGAGAGAGFRAPRVTVTGGRAGVGRAIAAAVQRHENALAATFAAEAVQAVADGGSPVQTVFDEVRGTVARSAHYLTIRLDESVNLGGAHPSNSVHAYVFDAATGREVTARSLFGAPRRVDRLVRAALIAQTRQVTLTAQDVAGLSIVPDAHGSTAPLSCYPIRAGLHCAVDQGGVLGYAAGAFEATVTWTALSSIRIGG